MNRGVTFPEILLIALVLGVVFFATIPGFIRSQTRTKLVDTELRLGLIDSALEAYEVDHGSYPPHGWTWHPSFPNGPQVLTESITTPVAYLQSFDDTVELFSRYSGDKSASINWPLWHINYAHFDEPWGTKASRIFLQRTYGVWRLTSAGPDSYFFNNSLNDPNGAFQKVVSYDPTNGTLSVGDIIRTDRNPNFSIP